MKNILENKNWLQQTKIIYIYIYTYKNITVEHTMAFSDSRELYN